MTTTKIAPPEISEDIWGDEPQEKSYWTVRYYKPSGFGVEGEWTNVWGTEQEAKWFAQGRCNIPQGMMNQVYAFKQSARVW